MRRTARSCTGFWTHLVHCQLVFVRNKPKCHKQHGVMVTIVGYSKIHLMVDVQLLNQLCQWYLPHCTATVLSLYQARKWWRISSPRISEILGFAQGTPQDKHYRHWFPSGGCNIRSQVTHWWADLGTLSWWSPVPPQSSSEWRWRLPGRKFCVSELGSTQRVNLPTKFNSFLVDTEVYTSFAFLDWIQLATFLSRNYLNRYRLMGPHGPQPPRGAVPFGQRSAAVCTEVPWHLGLSWKIHHDFETLEVELIRIISISMIRYMSIRILNKCSCWDVLGSKFKTYGGRMGMSWRHLFNLFRMWWEYHEISSNDGIIGDSSRKVGVPKGMKFKKNTERVSTWRILGLCGNYMKLQYQTHKMDGSILQKISRNTRPLPIEGLQTGTWTYSPTTWVCPQMGTMIDNDCVHRRVLSVFLA